MIDAHDLRCGQPQHGPGKPRRGWVRVHVAGDGTPPVWFCSITCAARSLAADVDLDLGRADVGTCLTCITRHDLQHTCRSCGHRPTLTYPHQLAGRTT